MTLSDRTAASGGWLDALAEMANELLCSVSPEGYFTDLNPAWERQLGWTRKELGAEPFRSFVHPDDADATETTVAHLLGPGSPNVSGFQNRVRSRDGDHRWYEWTAVAEAGVIHALGKDVTDRVAAEVERDRAAAFTRAITDSVVDGLAVATASGKLVFVNPAGLRLLGYESVEELVGRPIHETLHHPSTDGTPHRVEDCPLLAAGPTGRPVHVEEDVFGRKDGTALAVSFSSAPIPLIDEVGVVVSFRDASAAQAERDRLRNQGHDVVWFERIREALEDGRFVLYGQPIISLQSGEVTKHELLLRMISPTGEVIAPGAFLPAAEKYGLINDIDRWVISEGIRMAATGPVAINLSAESVGRPEILLHIEQELQRTAAPSANVTFEVTETALMGDIDAGRRFADRLVGLGCSFALDDFGTGYGTLTYLRQLPISHIKIDVQFVRDLPRSEADQKLVEAIVHIAKSLGKATVAEGVEDQETMDLLRGYGVDCAQGYHLGRPAPFAASPSVETSRHTSQLPTATRGTGARVPADPHASAAPDELTRDELARLRDVAADARDVAAAQRDVDSEHEADSLIAAQDLALVRLLADSKQARSRAAADRAGAKEDRQTAAAELDEANNGPNGINPAADERALLRTSNATMRDVIAEAHDREDVQRDESTLATSRSNISPSQAGTASRASSRADRRDAATDRQESATDRKHAAKTANENDDRR